MIGWQAVAQHFANKGDACALLDRNAQVVMFSAPFEALLGWPRDEIEGKSWLEAVVPADCQSTAHAQIERALSGTLRSFRCQARTATKGRLALRLDTSLVGRGAEQTLLLTVTGAEPIETSSPANGEDLDYEIAGSIADFGRLLALTSVGSPRVGALLRERCYTAIHGAEGPCADCPALHQQGESWPRTVVRRVSGSDAYEVVTAQLSKDRIQVRLRRISEQTLCAIQESKLRSVADSAQLSERERAVLTYLLMGRSLADIGTVLGISRRTVKFHQANLLEKLGADSRADLVRLVT